MVVCGDVAEEVIVVGFDSARTESLRLARSIAESRLLTANGARVIAEKIEAVDA
jgi:hypothetical protein